MPILLADLTTGTDGEPLTSDERNYIREVLGVSDITTDSKYKISERRFEALSAYNNKSARYWLTKYEEQGDKMTEIDAEGAAISKARNRQRIALALYNLVFADGTVTPLDNIDVFKFEEKRNKVSFVPINLDETITPSDEYGG